MKTSRLHALVTGIAAFLLAGAGAAQPAQQDRARARLELLPVRGNIYMLTGAGSNITVQVGPDGVLIVDSGSGERSDDVIAAVRTLTERPLRWIINTHLHPDHTGGNGQIAKTGRSVPQLTIGAGKLFNDGDQTATIVAHENVLKRMSVGQETNENLPLSSFFGKEKELFFNGEPIQIIHQEAAHTDGDVFVFFRRSDVVASGDVFVTTTYPVIEESTGGTINGFIDAVNELIHIMIPEQKQEGGTYVIPGHGRLSDEADVVEFQEMVTIVRDRIRGMVNQGMTLEQVKAAKPTLDYDARYGTKSATWTPDKFVEAVYRTMPRTAVRK
jgi:glyoxylase-like metal-dependent hydrolase (beta-lactamase superfamily II)